MRKKILVIEDDAAIKLGLHTALVDEGYEVHAASTGQDGLKIANDKSPDLVILDATLPGMNGYEICEHIRGNGACIPIIMLTADTNGKDHKSKPETGADEYLSKPFSIRELIGRVKDNLHRIELAQSKAKGIPETNGTTPKSKFSFGVAVVDFKRHEVYKEGKRQDVTNREFKLLEYFIQHPGEVLTRDRLLDEIWGYSFYPTTRTVDNHVLRLRKHVEPNPEHPVFIKTVRGAGYLFDLG
ncbi:MAG: response regulator transcription factor [Deferribacteres bacterium]|nr:response regulator transcription factor [candidate division KSB1 bacterium]MCB9510342.1 response regulator transcription factor [Deferribacteres bacterium]